MDGSEHDGNKCVFLQDIRLINLGAFFKAQQKVLNFSHNDA
jgi:hypothetical protein